MGMYWLLILLDMHDLRTIGLQHFGDWLGDIEGRNDD